jgi:serine/threonine-protein kinase
VSSVSWVPRIGAEFAGYRLVSLVGHGGMSIVYRAEHIGLGRSVALKLLSPQLSDDVDFQERFQRESRMAAALEHPNIIPIYEAGEENGVFYIAMRFVEGSDLKTRLKRDGPLEPESVIAVISQVAAALEAAHEKGLIHRDVKPANILIASGAGPEGSDHVYLADFGVAKNTQSAGLTRTGLFVGTADYASPEQIEGKPLDGRADVYSLGCVTYEALTAAPAYDKDSEVALMYAHLLEPPPKVTEKRPDLPTEVDDVIAKGVAKSRDDRYERPTDLAVALRQALRSGATMAAAPVVSAGGAQETVLASRPPGPAAGETQQASQSVPPPPMSPDAARRRRNLITAAVAGAIVLAGIIVAVIALTGGKSDKGAAVTSTPTTTAAGGGGGAVKPATSLMAVLVPTQIGKECAIRDVPDKGSVETDVCTTPPTAPSFEPNTFQFAFYPAAKPMLAAYNTLLTQARTGADGEKLLTCGSGAAGSKPWLHPTGKRGGSRFCFQDSEGNFVVAWTHEKLGSEDHVDTLAVAREPGRAPTTFKSWWSSVNDFIGKCRPLIGEEVCFATIQRLTGQR